jgi:hypothetical protein
VVWGLGEKTPRLPDWQLYLFNNSIVLIKSAGLKAGSFDFLKSEIFLVTIYSAPVWIADS